MSLHIFVVEFKDIFLMSTVRKFTNIAIYVIKNFCLIELFLFVTN